MAEPKKNTAFVTDVTLINASGRPSLKANPTLATGDVQVSTDEGAFANIGTLPTVTPAAGTNVKISLSAGEMNGDRCAIQFIDQTTPKEWDDVLIVINIPVRNSDDLAYPATSGRSIVVDASGLVDANAVKVGPTGSGTAQTARDVGASVLLSAGTGTGQLDFTSGVVKANLTQILATALTETAGLLAGGFKKFFNVAAPTGTLLSIPDAVPDAAGGLPITGNRLTAIPTVAAVTTVGSVSGAVGSVTGNVGGNVAGTVAGVTPAAAGAKMDLIDTPNATALAASADKLLGRAIQGGADGGRTVKSALRKVRNKVEVANGTMTVYAEDDSTPDHTATVTTAAGNPLASVDPV